MNTRLVSPGEVRTALMSTAEIALVDVREEHDYTLGHILLAVPIPLGRLDLVLLRLAPCRKTTVVFCSSDDDGLVEKAAVAGHELGYSDIRILEGGLQAWQETGYAVFTGSHPRGAALAETINHICRPPQITAAEVVRQRDGGEPLVILDSRSWDEFIAYHIPGAINCPLGELVYRIRNLVADDATSIVVNCAGRSHSTYGAQSLINASVPNPVFSLSDGTCGWWNAGFELLQGPGDRANIATEPDSGWAIEVAQRLANQADVIELDSAGLAQWRSESNRHSLYLVDVRTPDEFAAGHFATAVSAPGGQLVECSEDWIGVRTGRIVLLDDDGVRARMAASWLKQLCYTNVAVLAPGVVLPMNEPETSITSDDSVFVATESLEKFMRENRLYLDWQSTLGQEVADDGMLAFIPLSPQV